MPRTIALFLLPLISPLQVAAKAPELQIQGQLDVPSRPSALSLAEPDPRTGEMAVTSSVPVTTAGTFQLNRTFDGPQALLLKGNGIRIRLVADEPGTISLNVTSNGGEKRVQVVGSPANDRLQEFRSALDQEAKAHFGDLERRGAEAVAAGDNRALRALRVERDRAAESFYQALDSRLADLGPSAAAFVAVGYLDIRKQRFLVQSVYDRLEARYPDSPLTLGLGARLAASERVAEGAIAPDFLLADTHEETLRLSDLRGTPVLLEFWASWCLACRAEMPDLKHLARDEAAGSLQVVGITSRDQRGAWEAAIQRESLPWVNLWDEKEEVTRLYYVDQLPTRFLVDAEGRIALADPSIDEVRGWLGHSTAPSP